MGRFLTGKSYRKLRPTFARLALVAVLVAALAVFALLGSSSSPDAFDGVGGTPLETLPISSLNIGDPISGTWTHTQIDFTTRSGSASVAGDRWLFVWGGIENGYGPVDTGLLVNLDTGESIALGNAPISARIGAATVWTGTEFIVVGGYDFERSYVDGARYNPQTNQWSRTASAPLSPAKSPAATWTGSEMLLWLPRIPSEFGTIPILGDSQVAKYDPASNAWTSLADPPLIASDASFLLTGEGAVLVGGPSMRNLGSIGLVSAVGAAALDFQDFSWESLPGKGLDAESGRPVQMPGGQTAVLTDDGSLYVLEPSGWRRVAELPGECSWEMAGASNSGSAFLHYCELYKVTSTSIAPIPLERDGDTSPGAAESIFLVDPIGRLVILTQTESQQSPSDTALISVFEAD